MPQQKIENLMSELHTLFGTTEPSDEQLALMDSLKAHIHDINTSEPADPTPLQTIDAMLNQLGEEHPKTSAVLKELLKTLNGLGV